MATGTPGCRSELSQPLREEGTASQAAVGAIQIQASQGWREAIHTGPSGRGQKDMTADKLSLPLSSAQNGGGTAHLRGHWEVGSGSGGQAIAQVVLLL